MLALFEELSHTLLQCHKGLFWSSNGLRFKKVKTMKKLLLGATLGALSLMAMPALASTLNVSDGGTVCESFRQSTYTAASVGGCDARVRDLSNRAPGQILNFAGDATIYGYVADKKGTNNTLFPDFARMIFSSAAKVTLTLFNTDSAFDALVSLGGQSGIVDAANTELTFLVGAGQSNFFIDTTGAGAVNSAKANGSDYTIAVSEVPLPAGAVLLLTGFGGLTLLRRKKAA